VHSKARRLRPQLKLMSVTNRDNFSYRSVTRKKLRYTVSARLSCRAETKPSINLRRAIEQLISNAAMHFHNQRLGGEFYFVTSHLIDKFTMLHYNRITHDIIYKRIYLVINAHFTPKTTGKIERTTVGENCHESEQISKQIATRRRCDPARNIHVILLFQWLRNCELSHDSRCMRRNSTVFEHDKF